MNVLIYVVPLLLLGSIILFAVAVVIKGRPQRIGLLLATLALPMYALYYNDREPLLRYPLRSILQPLSTWNGDPYFHSSPVPAILIGAIYIIRVLVFRRVAIRRRLQHVNDPIANFFSGLSAVVLSVAVITSTFQWGWIGATTLGGAVAICYLGAIGTFGALVELSAEAVRYSGVWVKRKLNAFSTHVARLVSWLASLPRRLVPDIRSLVERLREGTTRQELALEEETVAGDLRLTEEFERGHDRDNH